MLLTSRVSGSNLKMMKFAILFTFVAVTAAEPILRLNPLSPAGRIVGGSDTTIERIPYQGSLQVFGIHICGASIIATRWILTAAQCMVYPPSWYSIRSGSTFSNRGGSVTAVGIAIVHDNYGVNSFGVPLNDIALLHLRASLVFSLSRAAIRLFPAGQQPAVGASGIVTGWGTLSEGGNSSLVLQAVTVPTVSRASCNAAYQRWGGLPAGQFCAAPLEGGRGFCNGDFGSPLAINGLLAGVASWGNGCARPGFPGVYAEVASYRSWINEISGL